MGFIPDSFELALLFLIISMFGWGLWSTTLKKCGKWRFEACYIYYAIGFVLTTAALVFTLGMMGQQNFFEVLEGSSSSDIFYAGLSGSVWNIGNILLVVSIILAGFAFAFPVGVGIAIVLGTIVSHMINPTADPFLLALGIVLIISGVVMDSLAYLWRDKNWAKNLADLKLKKE
jgi:glucose uptake protein